MWVHVATLRGLSVGTPDYFEWLQSFDDAERVLVMACALHAAVRS